MHHFTNSESRPDREAVEGTLKDFGFYHDFADVARMYAEYVNHGNYGLFRRCDGSTRRLLA